MSQLSFVFLQWFKRDLVGRYRGAWLGLSWPVLQPLAQVAVFTLIFHEFMSMRWPSSADAFSQASWLSHWLYAINVLAGLSVFNFFAEILGRAPVSVLSQPNLVTKVKFPLTILPMVTTCSALVHVAVGCLTLCLASWVSGTMTWHALWLLLWVLPVIVYGLGLALLLGSLGVYIRDIVQAMPAFTSMLMFLTPIFYPLSAVHEPLQALFLLNPLTWASEALREIVLLGQPLDLSDWTLHMVLAALLLALSHLVFRRLQSGFSDVL